MIDLYLDALGQLTDKQKQEFDKTESAVIDYPNGDQLAITKVEQGILLIHKKGNQLDHQLLSTS